MNGTTDTGSFADDTTILVYTVVMISLGSIAICFSAIAVLAMRRTRRTPETARFLHSGLLILNMTGIMFLMSRMLLFIYQSDLQFPVQIFGLCFVTLAHLTIGLMSIERLVIFAAPYFYVGFATTKRVKIIAYIFWAAYTSLYLFGRFGVCSLIGSTSTIADLADNCDQTFRTVHILVACTTILTSIGSYVQIYRIERSKKGHDENKTRLSTLKTLLHYKSTSVVILNLLIIYTVAVSSFFSVRHFFNDMLGKLVVFDLISIISSITDPFLYVIWFKECRYEIMKLFTRNPRKNAKLEKMRMEIFNIVVKENIPNVNPCPAES